MNPSSEDIAVAVEILERLAPPDEVHERSESKRRLAETMRAWPGSVGEQWWIWLREASVSLGLRSKVLDCTVDEALELAAGNAQIVCYRDVAGSTDGDWLAVLGMSRRRFRTLRSTDPKNEHLMRRRDLVNAFGEFEANDRIRCVVVQSTESALSSEHAHHGQRRLTPAERLWLLLRPESSDIWLVLIFALVVALLMLATPIAVEALVNTVAFGRFLQPIVVLALILLTFLGFLGAIRALQTYVVEIIQRRLFVRVAGDLAYRIPRAAPEAIEGEYMPELVNRFFDVVTVQKVAAQLLLDGIALVLTTLVGMAVLGFYHPWLLGFDVLLLTAIAIIVFGLGKGAVSSAVKESKHKYYMASWLEDLARCRNAFRHDGGTEYAMERADRLIHEYLFARRKHFRILMRQVIFALALQAVASTVLLGLGGWLVVSGELTLGQLVAAELIVTAIVGSFAKLGKHLESFYDLLASVDKLGVLFDIRTEREDGMLAVDEPGPARVELFDIGYSWPDQGKILNGLSAKIEPGDRFAVWGPQGSGKTTLLEIIYGLRAPSNGHLCIDGFDPQDMRPDMLRSRISLASGDEVFHASVEENVHLHRENVTATDVRDCLESLGILDPILRSKDGCETILTSDGAPLSATQRDLLSIARAAVGRPVLLLIDGLLDSLGEQDLDQCLSFLLDEDQPWTLVIATSREDIANRCSQVCNLQSGECATV